MVQNYYLLYEKLGGKNDYKDEIVYVYDYEKGDK